MKIVTELVAQVLLQMAHLQPVSPFQHRFLAVLLPRLLIVRGKVNFLNLSRYCALSERTLRRQFRQPFDWLTFNRLALAPVLAHAPTQLVAVDASFVPKSGKRTYGLDRFFNGCAGRVQKGLEVSLVSLIDVEANTAYALSVQQTPSATNALALPQTTPPQTRLDCYLEHLKTVVAQGHLPTQVRYGVFDGAFAHQKFVDGVGALGLEVGALGLEVVSKLRCDANLRYLYTGPQKARGRRRCYDGKVDFQDLSRWQVVGPVEPQLQLYTVVAYHPRLQRVLRVVLVRCTKAPRQARFALLFSSDVNLSAEEILRYYKARFQMEFLFRDAKGWTAKGWTGLTDCQARSAQALHFHFNAALSAVNLAKLQDLSKPERSRQSVKTALTSRPVFSLASWKQRAFNEHLLEKIIDTLELEPSWIKAHPGYDYLCNYGTISH